MARTAITIHGKNTILGIVKNIKAKTDSLKERCVETFCYVGERCLTEARKAGEYNDITGNLRRLYRLRGAGKWSCLPIWKAEDIPGKPTGQELNKGRLVKSRGDNGVKEGQALLDRLADEYSARYAQGIVLIVAAGMKYAVYVEELHNLNVLASAELLADELVPRLLLQLGFKKT